VLSSSEKLSNLPLLLFTWADPTTENTGWFEIEDIDNLEATTVYTPGWLVKEDSKNYYIIQSIGEHKDIYQPMTDGVIPKGCVVSITHLKWSDEWKLPPNLTKR
jgi:hypothetical protein